MRLVMRSLLLALLCTFFSSAIADGKTLQMPVYFSDHMVIQREKKVCLKGQASPGELVQVAFNRQTKEIRVDETGRWKLDLEPMKAGGPYEMIVNTARDTLRYSDVLVGEVWFAAGQSNMAFRLRTLKKEEYEQERAEADFPQIRYYGTAGVVSGGKLVETSDLKWSASQTGRMKEWSAVAWFFAKEIHKRYGVPVGIVTCAQGSSTAEAWLSPKAYRKNPELKKYMTKEYSGIQALYRNPSVLYQSMLSKFQGMTLRGIIWYQGESNAYDPAKYRPIFKALIEDWREFFREPDLPFIYAQLPAYRMPGDQSGEKWAEMRQVQLEVAQSVPRTALVVTSEYGEAGNIHPKNKYPVARRFVLAAEGLAYGEQILYQVRIPEKAIRLGNKVQIVFPDSRIRLVVRGEMMLEICGEEGKYYPAEYKLKKNKLTVWCRQVSVPVNVRYAYANVNRLALYDRSGVAVSPFCVGCE